MNLVLGYCSGYNYHQVSPFVESLTKVIGSDRIVFFVSCLDSRTIKRLRSKGIELIFHSAVYPYFEDISPYRKDVPAELKDKHLSPNSLRYILYRAFLKSLAGKVDWILHSDTRDVVFQSNPFQYYNQEGLYCFLEDSRFSIKDDSFNSNWIKFGFGDELFNEIKNQPICCSGVTLGSHHEFQLYLDKMVEKIIELPDLLGLDQGIHNVLLFKNQLGNVILVPENFGVVATLGHRPYDEIQYDQKGCLLNCEGDIVPVIHQYDRHPQLLWKFNKSLFCRELLRKRKRELSLIKRRLMK